MYVQCQHLVQMQEVVSGGNAGEIAVVDVFAARLTSVLRFTKRDLNYGLDPLHEAIYFLHFLKGRETTA